MIEELRQTIQITSGLVHNGEFAAPTRFNNDKSKQVPRRLRDVLFSQNYSV
jgi:hypothetical protein